MTDGVRGELHSSPPASEQSKTRSRRRRPFSRGRIATVFLAVLIGAGAVWHADWLLAIKDPPPVSAEPVISLLLWPGQQLTWATNTEYQVVEKFRRCQNPVTVELDALVNGTNTAINGPTLTPQGFAHGDLTDPLNQAGKVELLENTEGVIPPHFVIPRDESVQREGRDGLLFGAPLRAWYPSVVQYGMGPGASARAPLVEVRFQADWVLPRSPGTCYVRFPAVQVPQFDPMDGANPAAPLAATAGPGEVSVISMTDDSVDWQASIPPPTDPRIPQWSCANTGASITAQYTAPDCGGVAVFSAPGAASRANLLLLIDGAFIGLAAALFVDRVTKIRERLDEPRGDGS